MGSEVTGEQMSDTDTAGGDAHGPSDTHHPGDIADEPHGPDDHGETHGHDDHADGSEALGPIDVQAWGALAIGIGLGLLVAVCIALSTGAI
jgi:hypothetical protein